ncbi:hypothetical protein DAEQUDRAFT_730788 [Daedalea quercina L-15889]|uniref:Mediator of RNA polymerase II transcription subunit 20 n=1 Tax=Daedalea quercina L-15889 TaxID=1314783 RepID=A0A165MRC3_9APHY|nr:hypothetical protein DAEQUDRAFT_730788 [Daedalea quercina L-15889]
MGFTGLVRWTNAPSTGVDLIRHNITVNHQGVLRGRWQVGLSSWRSRFTGESTDMRSLERPLYTVTMNENTFVMLEDPAAPNRGDYLKLKASQEQGQPQQPFVPAPPPHYHYTLVTVSPPGALEQLMSHLGVVGKRWVRTGGEKGQGSGHHLSVDGLIFSIGNDWLVRFGHVMLAGGSIKGMLIEAEYLPLPDLHTEGGEGRSELLSDFLASVIPLLPDSEIWTVAVSDEMWAEVLAGLDEDDAEETESKMDEDEDDVFISPDFLPVARKTDWLGVNRDKRSAYLIQGALKGEALI